MLPSLWITSTFIFNFSIKNIVIRDPNAAKEPKKVTVAEKLLSGKVWLEVSIWAFSFARIYLQARIDLALASSLFQRKINQKRENQATCPFTKKLNFPRKYFIIIS